MKTQKFFHHFRKICTIKSFQKKKFERSDNYEFHPCMWQNSTSRSAKTKIFIYKVTFPLQPLVGLMHNSTTAKEQQKWPS